MVTVKRLHNLAKSLVRIVLLVPHVFVVFHLALLIQRQSNQRVDFFGRVEYFGSVGLLELEDYTIGLGFHDFGLESLGLGEGG